MTFLDIVRARSLTCAAAIVLLFTARIAAQTSATPSSEEESTTVGGYGEVHYTEPEGLAKGTLDVARFVIFMEHTFNQQLTFSSELEVEHTKIQGGQGGEVALE